jgi:hypothetical protein
LQKNNTLIAAAILAVLLAVGVTVQMHLQKKKFEKNVVERKKTSAGYDQKFIAMVNRLEEELTMRASFGYEGGKDPMTGKKRRVVIPKRRITRKPTKKTSKAPVRKIDPVKLTAIIYDDEKTRYTAVVMDGERSFSVEVGDKVRNRRITRITEEVIYMEDAKNYYKYDIFGHSGVKKK